MQFENADRRRVALATFITIVALPTLWLTSRDQASDGALNPVAVAVSGGAPVFMAGPTVPPSGQRGVVTPTTAAQQTTGMATYRRWDARTLTSLRAFPCQTSVAPSGTRLTVTNVNNGRSVRCINVVMEPAPDNALVLMHTDALLDIGRLADAPLPVRVSW